MAAKVTGVARSLAKLSQTARVFVSSEKILQLLPLITKRADYLRNTPPLPLFPRFLTTATNGLKAASPTQNEDGATAEAPLEAAVYNQVCCETLDALCDYFEELTEDAAGLKGCDVAYSDGVLTIKLGERGTYVINRQTPNKQIWLSSPTSGPKRFDFIGARDGRKGKWIYKHTGETIHELLQREMKEILKNQPIDFFQLPHGH